MSNPETKSSLIIPTGSLTDTDVLFAYMESDDGQLDPAKVEPAVASEILAQGIVRGAELVLPVSGLIARTIKERRLGSKDDGSLMRLRGILGNTNDVRSRVDTAMLMGDRGTLFAAQIGSDSLSKLTGETDSYQRYAMGMALVGYETALSVFEQEKRLSRSSASPDNLRILLKRLQDAVLVLKGLVRKEVSRVLC